MGSALEIYPLPVEFRFRRLHPELSDADRIASDWYRIGQHLQSAIGKASDQIKVNRAEAENEADQ